jgi:hypothetical protein
MLHRDHKHHLLQKEECLHRKGNAICYREGNVYTEKATPFAVEKGMFTENVKLNVYTEQRN